MSLQIKTSRAVSQGTGFVRPGVGDPGLGSFFGGVLKKAGGFIGGPIGGLLGAAGSALSPGQAAVAANAVSVSKFAPQQQGPPGPPGTLTINPPFAGAPGVSIGLAGPQATNGAMRNGALAGGCPTGFHPNKTDYFLKNGTFVQRGTRCVKNRRRNALNPRAADRAIARIESAKRATKRLSRITIRKKCPK